MSKPKKPAEDKSKAGAVTNSIANEVDEILDLMWRKTSCWKPDINELAKSALLTLIADRERKARLLARKETIYEISDSDIKFKHSTIELLAFLKREVNAALQAEDKEGQE